MTRRARGVARAAIALVFLGGGENAVRPDGFDPRPTTIDVPYARPASPLTRAEQALGWRTLGEADAWRSAEGDAFPEEGWSFDEGTLTIREAGPFEFRAGGALFSRERFGDFILEFEFWIARGGNSGVKYRAQTQRQLGYVHALGCEFQILDDARHADANRGRPGTRRLAGLYDLIAPLETPFRGVETWNHGRIHLEKGRLSHYLNGVRVVDVQMGSPAWQKAVSGSKFADREGYCASPRGHLVLQDHGDEARFRNLRVRSLDPADDDS